MRHTLTAALAAAALTVGSAGLAQAAITYSVSGVALSTGGTLSGSFTTDNADTTVTSFDITAPALSPFAGYHYVAGTATVTASTLPSQFFRLDGPSNTPELQFYFANGLTPAGGTLLTSNSYENEPSGGNRFLSGAVLAVTPTPVPTSVPEPGSLLLLGAAAGLGLAGHGARRRRAAG